MTSAFTGESLQHPALAPGPGEALAAAHLTDRQRIALLLQASALVSHLRCADWHLPNGWQGATVDEAGLLRSVTARKGRTRRLPQELLTEFLREVFPGDGKPAGRGAGRRLARQLADEWRQTMVPIEPDAIVTTILAGADFLWDMRYSGARSALAARYVTDGNSWWNVAGRRSFRRRLLARSANGEDLPTLLSGPDCRELWFERTEEDGDPMDPMDLLADGRRAAAIRRWSEASPKKVAERLLFARALYDAGLFLQGLEQVRGQRSAAARGLRALCQARAGRTTAARRTIRQLEEQSLSDEELMELAEVAVQVFADKPERAKVWIDRVRNIRSKRSKRAQLLAHILSALTAWDRGQSEDMEKPLTKSRDALQDERLSWRWRQARALQGMAQGKGEQVVSELAQALKESRRRLRRFEISALWNDLALGRAQLGDLAGAERGFLHAAYQLRRCEGERKKTLALMNLAEVRLRQGRLTGVEDILRQSQRANRAEGNIRGLVQDLEMWARFELVQGQPRATLAYLREAEQELDRHRLEWHRDEQQILAARALGWMGNRRAALQRLQGVASEAFSELDPEERPAAWLHAGDRERALEEAEDTPVGRLWQKLIVGAGVADLTDLSLADWEALDELEPYRSARTVFDIELAFPENVPSVRVRRAGAVLRRLGAGSMAERLAGRDTGPWLALGRYLEREVAEADAIGELFDSTGYGEVSLRWMSDDDLIVLVDGSDGSDGHGGAEELALDHHGGRLELRAPIVDRALETLFAVVRRDFRPPASRPRATPAQQSGMLGSSPKLQQVLARVARLAGKELPVLILGETGTGKELLAQEVHRLSPRAKAPFLPINCAALSESLLLSDLFGHVRGAFTGADRDRAGIFETARGGTVFLDEIGDLPLTAQGSLLRVLQEGEVRRVGESVSRRVDVRVVTATHQDLGRMVREKSFRQDLYYRLKAVQVELPPLRDRGADILLLAEHFLSVEVGGQAMHLSKEARRSLEAHSWPGNIRELRDVISVASALADGNAIEPGDLDLPVDPRAPTGDYQQRVVSFRRQLIVEALEQSGGNRAAAARRLGLTRQALSYLIKKLEIE